MKKFIQKNSFIALTLILVLSLVFPAINTSAKKADSGKFDMKVSYGINGKYRAMKYLPVTINIKSLENDFRGDIEIRVSGSTQGTYDAYSTSISLTKGEDSQVVIPAKVSEVDNKFTVNLVENGESILEEKIILSEGRISEGSLLTGLVTDDATAIGYLGDVSYSDPNTKQTGSLNIGKIDINSIGDNPLNIDAIDVIVINNFNMGNFKQEHYDSLNAWINKGGTLVIGSGVNESKTVKLIDKSLLEIKSKGNSNKNVKLINENLNLSLSNLEIKDSKVILGTSGEELVYEVSRGNGRILVSTFDLGTEPLISSNDATEVFNRLLVSDFEKISMGYMKGNDYSYMSENLLRNIPVNKVVNVSTLALILGIYALIIGVVLYLVLKKMQKRDLIWIAVPILAVGFSLAIYFVGSGTRVNDLIVNQVNIIDIKNDGQGAVKGYVGIGTKYKDDVSIEKPKDIVMNFKGINNYYGNPEEKPATKLRVKTTYRDGNSYFDFADSNALEIKSFSVVGKDQILPKIENKFNYNGGKLNGTVKNNLDSDIHRLILVSGQNIWDLGSVKKGEELNIEKVEVQKVTGIEIYGSELANRYWEAKYQKNGDIKSEEFKDITRHGNALQMLTGEVNLKEGSKLIAITDMEIDYGIKFSKKNISKYDTTVVVQNSVIDFKDEQGNVNFPKGYFKGVVESKTGNANADEYGGIIYGSGEVVFGFKVNDEYEILNIDVSKNENNFSYKGGQGSQGTGEYYVYNYKNSSYEKIDLSSLKEITLSDVSNYSEGNKIKVKVENKNEGMTEIPQVTIKGRVK